MKGDVRKLRAHHFPVLRHITLPSSVLGGFTLENIADVMEALAPLQRRTPELFGKYRWHLSSDSPDYYFHRRGYRPEWGAPFLVKFVTAGARLGWRWSTGGHVPRWDQPCEIHWLDPEPPNLHDDQDPNVVEYLRALKELTKNGTKDILSHQMRNSTTSCC